MSAAAEADQIMQPTEEMKEPEGMLLREVKITQKPTPLVHIYTQNIRSQLPDGIHPSAGALPTADRLSAPNIHHIFLACQTQLSLIQPIHPTNPTIVPGRQSVYTSDFIPLTSQLTPLKHHGHRTEIQNVEARSIREDESNEYLVGSIDSYGVGIVSRMQIPSRSETGSTAPKVLSTHRLNPPRIAEDGWHGIRLHPIHSDQFTTVSYYGKSLSMYQGEQLLQTLYTAASPTSFQYMSAPHFNEPLLVCNEGNILSVWDLRLSNQVGQVDNVSRGAIQRLSDTTGDLFALDTHPEGIVATGGVDKQVTVYDGRKWQVSGRWKNVLKYEIMSIQFTAFSSSYLYVTGLDHEVYCGHWNNQALNQRNLERTAFRGDARWIGITRTSDLQRARGGGDQLVGVTESSQLYFIHNAPLQNGPLDATGTMTQADAEQLARTKQQRDANSAQHRANQQLKSSGTPAARNDQLKQPPTAATTTATAHESRKRKAETEGERE